MPSALDDTIPASDRPDGDDDAAVPTSAERYRYGAELGRGGMGRVVEAFDTTLGRTVALKEVLPKGGASIARRFRREVQITARLEHASIVPLYDAGVLADGRPFYVMRRVSGRPLDELIARTANLADRLALLPNMLAAIDAVAHAHRRGVIHRDLKPANILVGELGETVVIDWGLAKVIGEDDDVARDPFVPAAADSLQTQFGAVFGTPGFMAPEQARGDELGPGSDVYALGATLYQLLVGRPPVAGDSASGLIASTLEHAIVPVAQACPGAPAELVAIVDKALSSSADARYRDASALGEDVRRFQTGQLVAAHRYTRRERIARLVRRHRAPLAVAALASVAVSALAGFSVHRILEARDDADEARRAAELRRHEAEDSRDKLSAQYDALVIEQAREALDRNATQALALLKQLAPGSVRAPAARAIAKAAVARGVAWALQAPDAIPVYAELSVDASRLLEISGDQQTLDIWDLDARRRVGSYRLGHVLRARWVVGNRVLETSHGEQPQIFDPATGRATKLPVGPFVDFAISDDGKKLAFVDTQGKSGVIDLETMALVALPITQPVAELQVAPSGDFVGVADGAGVTVFDSDGHVAAHRDGRYVEIAFSRGHDVAILEDSRGPARVFATDLAGSRAWTEVPVGGTPVERVIYIYFRGTELELVVPGAIIAWRPDHRPTRVPLPVFTVPQVDDAAIGSPGLDRDTAVRDGVTVMVGAVGRLHYLTNSSSGDLALPGALPHARLVGRRGHARVVTIGEGSLFVFELDAVVPAAVPIHDIADATYLGERELLIGSGSYGWMTYELATGKQTALDSVFLMTPTSIDVEDHTAVLISHENTDHVAMVRAGLNAYRELAVAPYAYGRPVRGDGVVYTPDDGHLYGVVADGAPFELGAIDGRVSSMCTVGQLEFAAISVRGDLVRGSLATHHLEHAHVDVSAAPIVGADLDGHLVIASGNRLLRWDGSAHELARFGRPITAMRGIDGGVIVILEGGDSHLVSLAVGSKPRGALPPMLSPPALSADGRELAALGVAGQLNLVDLPDVARWTLPARNDNPTVIVHFGPDNKLLQGTAGGLLIWTLPDPGGDLAAWLDEQSNATVTPDGVLLWPWQAASPP